MGTSDHSLAREPAEAPRIAIGASPTRCPFCHESVDPTSAGWFACAACLARHHGDCWRESGRCATCGGATPLGVVALPPRAMRILPRFEPYAERPIARAEMIQVAPPSRALVVSVIALGAVVILGFVGVVLAQLAAAGTTGSLMAALALAVIVGLVAIGVGSRGARSSFAAARERQRARIESLRAPRTPPVLGSVLIPDADPLGTLDRLHRRLEDVRRTRTASGRLVPIDDDAAAR